MRYFDLNRNFGNVIQESLVYSLRVILQVGD